MQESYAIREWCVERIINGTPSARPISAKEIIFEAKKLEHYILNIETEPNSRKED